MSNQEEQRAEILPIPCDTDHASVSTIRVANRRRFTQIDRRSTNDVRLSFKARGLLLWVLDKPNDWSISIEFIAVKGSEPDGRTAVASALKELERYGYLVRTKHRDTDGRFQTEHLVYEHPDDALAPEQETRSGPEQETGAGPEQVNRRGKPAFQRPETVEPREATAVALPGINPPPPATPTEDTPARAIARAVWERTPRPAKSFMGVVKVFDALIGAGHDIEAVQAAAMVAPTITVSAMEMQLARATPRAVTRQPIDEDRGGHEGRIDL